MSNLDWLRTLSAERLVDWFYSEWLGKMAKQTTNSMLYMTEWPNSERNEVTPPVQPERKEAEWILLDDCSNAGYYCSNCQKKVVREGWSKTVKKIKYCPNCGFRMGSMRGEQDVQNNETMESMSVCLQQQD